MQELIPINILIGDRTYRVKIKPEDEASLRSTVKTINDKILEFKTQFAGKDMQDYVAMVMVWYATQFAGNSNAAGNQAESGLTAALHDIEQQLNQLLSSQ